MAQKDLMERENTIPRDLSWLDFNERVMDEAKDLTNPLLERAKFLAIFVNNLDEFYMVRMAGLLNVIANRDYKKFDLGIDPVELKARMEEQIRVLMQKLYTTYQDVMKECEKNQILIKKFTKLTPQQKKFVKDYFEQTLFPIITPLAIDPGHPFPVLPSKTIAFAINVRRKTQDYLAIIPVPTSVPRLIALPSAKGGRPFILVEEVIEANLKSFFRGYTFKDSTLFRVIRDSELSVEEYAQDLLKAIEDDVRHRSRSKVVALQIKGKGEPALLRMLGEGLDFYQEEMTFIEGDLDLTFLFELVGQIRDSAKFFPELVPAKVSYENIFDKITQEEFIVHLPFQTFSPTVDLIETASKDKNVLAIKMTLYRTNWDSAIIKALKEAARQKKQVTILVEIKARFDEEINIRWARELEEAGCHVIYGIPGLKVHSKMAMVVRKEEDRIRRYVHLSTGNYNEKTARQYTDIGYFTSNEDVAKDISDIFNVITGYSLPSPSKRVVTSPANLRDTFLSLIDREIKFNKKNKNGAIKAKFNTLELEPISMTAARMFKTFDAVF